VIVLVRHAQTAWSISGQHTGRTDIPLTEQGQARARILRQALSGWDFQRVLVSPSRRARETCELCGLGAQARVCEDLHEWDYGEYEGLTTAQIQERQPGWVLWRDGCPGGEQAADVGARADRAIAELGGAKLSDTSDTRYKTAEPPGAAGDVVLFSHGHLLRVFGARWIELPPQAGAHLALSAGAICVLGYERGARVLARWNDSH
jgi:broad specificity phosphatase PhoE